MKMIMTKWKRENFRGKKLKNVGKIQCEPKWIEREREVCRTSSRNTGLDGDTLIRWQSGEGGELISDGGELVSKRAS